MVLAAAGPGWAALATAGEPAGGSLRVAPCLPARGLEAASSVRLGSAAAGSGARLGEGTGVPREKGAEASAMASSARQAAAEMDWEVGACRWVRWEEEAEAALAA